MTFSKRPDIGQRHWERTLSAEEVASRRQMEEMNARLRTCDGCKEVQKSPFGGPEVACKIRQRPPRMCVEDTRRCELYDDGNPHHAKP